MASKEPLSIVIDQVHMKNLEQLKMINNVIFPLKFPDQLYKDCLAAEDTALLAYHNDVVVGGIASRCEKLPGSPGKAALYIATVAVLAPYRGYSIGRRLLDKVLDWAKGDSNIEEAYCHVQVNNEDSLDFFKKAGFEVRETIKDYYKKLTPSDAIVLYKKL
mmetsp:Transcript_19978/g.35940  ORF Transcript_19978/g.35940 Transcript_19978/m.35940 type:complete len:161 (-) Transcript_19978:319-801(-)|eukprot:CAMPEP_0175039076 /NCGR_PEP_ID=MMETSP0052_2-20121109/311_1 /TAXON_ID=51329 ORGANISM="Polytomella parva, Strain SAG 63-3" /NCGR_SAMPLE_ID=MMETSP0052_2 /ASSEMBLY_ACC=CAM_ASM_000194 /LENGTH=160 /DNA_ID=CAMNT_0016300745 /DNA_START=33 /DNA_END=515 /DNA_ORIENTATION=-